jgi:hypothetical protein
MPLVHIDTVKIRNYARALQLNKGKFIPGLVRIMNEAGRALVDLIKKRLFSGRPGLRTRSGALKESYSHFVTNVGGNVELSVTSSSPYERIHREGGTITPTSGSMLAIPVPCGVGQIKIAGNPSNYPGRFAITVTNRGLFLVDKTRDEISHVLVPSVRIPARLDYSKVTQSVIRKFKPQVVQLVKSIVVK